MRLAVLPPFTVPSQPLNASRMGDDDPGATSIIHAELVPELAVTSVMTLVVTLVPEAMASEEV